MLETAEHVSARRTTCSALGWLRKLSREIVALWDDIDVLLTPTLAQPPIEIGALAAGPRRAARSRCC